MPTATKKRVVPVDLRNLPEVCNPTFWPLFADKSRYLVLKGGGSSGKSVFAAQKKIYRTLTEPGHKFLVVRKVKADLRDSAFAELKNVIRAWGMTDLFLIPEGRSSELYLKCRVNSNEIIFYGLDDVERRKSLQGITGMWIEEPSELTVEDFRQLDIRMRGKTPHYKQIILSFNPVWINHWLKGEFFDRPKPNATTHHSTYQDNKFLPDEDKAVLEGFKGVDDYYYTVYCLGGWGVLGKTIFDAQKVSERLAYLRGRKPLKEGFFVYEYQVEKVVDNTIKWINEPGGYIRIYEKPQKGYPYVIGGDTAGEGSDSFTGQVLNNMSGKQVATLKHQFDEDLYAKQMYCLGRYYNNALLGIETNYSTYPVKELARLGYPNQFMRETEDSITHKLKKVFGFQTTKLTRPVAISGLVELVREHTELFSDIATLEEMLTFVRNEQGKAEAQEGKHDDLIMALAIAYYVRGQQTFSVSVEPQAPKEKLIDKLAPKASKGWKTI